MTTLLGALLIGAAAVLLGRWGNQRCNARHRFETLRALREAFLFVETDYCMRCVREVYDPVAFGNAYVDFESDGRFFRAVKDRGQYFFSLGTSENVQLVEGQLLKRCGAHADLAQLVQVQWRSLPLLAEIARRRFPQFLRALPGGPSSTYHSDTRVS
jgi:hypothetical protein